MIAAAGAGAGTPSKLFRPADGLVTRRVLDETLIVPVRGTLAEIDQVYSLSGAAAAIWERLDGKTGLDEVRRAVGERFDAPAETISADLQDFIGELLRAGLIVEQG